jgi:hypothetical protein
VGAALFVGASLVIAEMRLVGQSVRHWRNPPVYDKRASMHATKLGNGSWYL